MKYYIGQSPNNPLTRIVAAIIAAVCLMGAFFFGLVILAVIAVVIAAFSLVFWVRIWWSRKKDPVHMAQPSRNASSHQNGQKRQEIIEGEYTVLSERRD